MGSLLGLSLKKFLAELCCLEFRVFPGIMAVSDVVYDLGVRKCGKGLMWFWAC